MGGPDQPSSRRQGAQRNLTTRVLHVGDLHARTILNIGRCAIAVAAFIVANRPRSPAGAATPANPVLLCDIVKVDAVFDDNRVRVTVLKTAVLFQWVIIVLKKIGSISATLE